MPSESLHPKCVSHSGPVHSIVARDMVRTDRQVTRLDRPCGGRPRDRCQGRCAGPLGSASDTAPLAALFSRHASAVLSKKTTWGALIPMFRQSMKGVVKPLADLWNQSSS